jgi:hypothetical protein
MKSGNIIVSLERAYLDHGLWVVLALQLALIIWIGAR